MEKITIFTPTYNRAYSLPKLYNSLLKQDSSLFEWLIIDDGSTDNTKDIINKWILEQKIVIRYCYQENAGKMVAHNKAVEFAENDLFMCVDSDDFLLPNAINILLTEWNKCRDNKDIAGIVAYRRIINEDGEFIEHQNIPIEIKISRLRDLIQKKHINESSLMYRTSILKEYPFPIMDGEKFISEQLIYNKIDDRYQMHVCHHDIQACMYQEDGYTRNIHKIIAQNPKGFILYYEDLYLRSNNKKLKIKYLIQIIACCLIAKRNVLKELQKFGKTFCFLPLIPLGYLYKYKKLNKYLPK